MSLLAKFSESQHIEFLLQFKVLYSISECPYIISPSKQLLTFVELKLLLSNTGE